MATSRRGTGSRMAAPAGVDMEGARRVAAGVAAKGAHDRFKYATEESAFIKAAEEADVIVVGAGMAGLTTALRLAERGLKVVIIEQDDFTGGKWGAHPTKLDGREVYHEHCYHMFLNWFFNFWRIVDELGLRDEFEPQSELNYLREGEFPHTTAFRDVGSPSTILHNVLSGVLPPADSFIYAYSLIDLLAEPIDTERFRDRFSVNGFMSSRAYSTDTAAMHHQRTLAKAFACPSYRTSAATYKKFIKYGYRHPEPMMWILKGDCEQHFHAHLRKRLESLGCRFAMLYRAHYVELENEDGEVDELPRVTQLVLKRMKSSPTVHEQVDTVGEPLLVNLKAGADVVLTVPPGVLDKLLNPHLYLAAPELANVRRLRSEPMASMDLYFNCKLANLPRGHVVLLDSPHDITFVDNSQFWPDEPNTVLNVVASNTDPLDFERANQREVRYRGASGFADNPDWVRNTTARVILEELRQYLPFNDDDIAGWHVQTNTGEALFVNETGTSKWRPKTTCGVDNLFLAGDYCKHAIDVVTVESATLSGLMAAEAIRLRRLENDADGRKMSASARKKMARPIEMITPDHYPEGAMAAMRLALAPWAYGAKLWATATSEMKRLAGD